MGMIRSTVGLTSAEEITEVLKDDDDERLILKGVIAKNIPFRSLYDNVYIKEYLRRLVCTCNTTVTPPGDESKTSIRSTVGGWRVNSMAIVAYLMPH
eukprot:scaffold6875_cov159-Ochromonas_danica.AAC.4